MDVMVVGRRGMMVEDDGTVWKGYMSGVDEGVLVRVVDVGDVWGRTGLGTW